MPKLDSPALARRRVRLALKSARQEKHLTQGQVAQAMQWSLSKVIRIEKGEVSVSANDLRALLNHLEVTDPEQVRQLLDDAWLSRRERWAIDPADREHMTSAMLELYQYESASTTVRYYSNLVVPGIVQTRAYAQAIFDLPGQTLTPDTVAARIEVRRSRLQRVLYQPGAPRYLVLLDESVLYRSLGSASMLADQLDDLLRIMRDTTLSVRIVPFSIADLSNLVVGPFVLYDLEGDQSALLYRESFGEDEVIHSEAEVERHRVMFDRTWELALGDGASVDLIKRHADLNRRAAGDDR